MNQLTAFIKAKPLLFAASVVFIIAFFIICNPAGLYFLCDDFAHIPQSSKGNLFQTHLLRPAIYCTLWLDIKAWNMNATGFHITNLVIHIANSVLVYFVSLTLFKRYTNSAGKPFLSLLTALLFLCYAFHSEPVFWIAARGGSLAALFIQLSLLFYFKGSIKFRALALIFFVAGLFTYELSWIVPLLLTLFYLYDVYLKREQKSYLPVTAYWYVLSGYLFLRYFTLKGSLSGYEFGNVLNNNFFRLLNNYTSLLARTFLPPVQNSKVFFAMFVVAGGTFFFLFIYFLKKQKSNFWFLVLLFSCIAVSLLPVISLGIDTHDSESERFIYPATIFACLFIVFALHAVIKKMLHFQLAMAGFIIFHLYFLQQAGAVYRYASYVSRFTIEALNNEVGVKKLIFTNLPAQYKGGLIFRIGFPVWAPQILNNTYETVEIQSFKELTERKKLVKIDERKDTSNPELHVEFKKDTLKLYEQRVSL